MPGVLVVGSANMDLVVRTPRLPVPGETVMGLSFATFPGGKGANQAVAVGMLGGDVHIVAMVGSDSFGQQLTESLANAGVITRFVWKAQEGASGVAAISVDDLGQNCIVVAPGANALLKPGAVRAAMDALQPRVVLVQLEVPIDTVRETVRLGRERGVTTILNPAPAQPLPEDLLQGLSFLTPNETEAESLTGISPTDPPATAACVRRLLDRGVERVVMTMGAAGCLLGGPEGLWHYPSVPIEAVDTTAAGDAFNGALAAFLEEGKPLDTAIRLANRVGAVSATRPGAQSSMPTRQEVLTLGMTPEPTKLSE